MLGMFINKAKAYLLEREGQSLHFALLLYPLHSTIPCMTFEFALYHNIVLDQMKNKHISSLHMFSDKKIWPMLQSSAMFHVSLGEHQR